MLYTRAWSVIFEDRTMEGTIKVPRVSQQTVNSLLTIIRLFFLSLTVAALLAIYCWQYHPSLISSLDDHLSKTHFETINAERNNAYAAFVSQNYKDAVLIAADSLGRMEYMRKTTHLYSLKRDLLLILIQSKVSLGEAVDALPYARSWSLSDERDAEALLAYIQVLKELPDHNKEKLAAVALFKTRFPGQKKWPPAFL